MTMVQIEKPEDAKLADWFAELRLWFDKMIAVQYYSEKQGE